MPRMGRPMRWRRVEKIPQVTYFKPAGIPMVMLEEVTLTVDEIEAIRLKDIENLEQEEGAQKMSVSRSTFARVLASARQKVADALINGKAVRIEGGNFQPASQRFTCEHGHQWDVPFETSISAKSGFCPECSSENVIAVPQLIQGTGRHRRRMGGC
jgi:uncharacterized protein